MVRAGYCWKADLLTMARGEADSNVDIYVNGEPLSVTKNLHDFLSVLHARRKKDKWFWADQMCIHQAHIEERNHQVSLMGKVYASAKEVYAFLGPGPASSKWYLRNPDNFFPAHVPDDQLDRRTEEISFAVDMLSRPYWTRLWIVQELRLAQDVVFWCGDFTFARAHLRRKQKWLVEHASRKYAYPPAIAHV